SGHVNADPTPASSPVAGTVSFLNDVMPVLTKAGCNAGTCHAKAGLGQNGFRLSVLGFEPADDYEHIVKEARGRRVSVASPDDSLLLMKASARVPHGGGRRLDPDSAEYLAIRRWIEQGALPPSSQDPTVVALAVEPASATVAKGATTPLTVMAHSSDGSSRNVTNLAVYESNDPARIEVDPDGSTRVQQISGRATVMVRYQGVVGVASFAVPAGPASPMPTPRHFIDELVFENLASLGIPASPECSDGVFLRRVSLDVTGALPSATLAMEFLASSEVDKRQRLVERLLASSEYADFFANKWTTLLKNRRDDTSDLISNFAFHSWIRDGLLANKPFDAFVRELIGATGTVVTSPPVAWYKRVKDPKEQIEDVAQLFLGVRMQCAQCHHHPFERWSQNDYYGMAAFFSQVGRKPSSVRNEDLIFHKRGLAGFTNPRTAAPVRPVALGEAAQSIAPDDDPRLVLADWMASPSNPFFAKVLVNRYWKHFFGRGLVEPEDDLRDTNPPSNPRLLTALADHFIASKFDLKELVRTITGSRAYHAAAGIDGNEGDLQNFSHAYGRRLTAEVLLDSIDRVAETTTSFANLPVGTRAIALPDNSYNRSSAFLQAFGRPDNASVCECERSDSPSLAQSLFMVNAADIKGKLSSAQGRAARYARETRPDSEKIHELTLAALSREPTMQEVLVAEAYLSEAGVGPGAEAARKERFEDLIWVLINTKEFVFNH
ncbi:MAG: DUF1549 domain-containing protein, partial [Planctomycetaceae bacterium]